jgi:tetratricopeptide (TPR) repeat protein
VATKARAKWMLLGNILQVDPEFVLTSQLVDVASGKVAASQRIDGQAGEKIFSMVDKLTVEIKNDLSLPAAAQNEPDRAVADVTTHSPEAYRYYLEGVDYGWKFYWAEAQKNLEKALELDSTFVMAYYRLAGVRRSEAQSLLAKAMIYLDKVSWKERHYVKGAYAFHSGDYAKAIEECRNIIQRYPDEKEAFWTMGYIYAQTLQQPEKGIRYLSKAIEIDPLYKIVYNQLAYDYNELGDFDKSIWAINKYISIAPDEANPYDSRGDLYAYNGKLDQAIESYKKALEIKPDFYMSLRKLGDMYLFKREYAKAESCYQELCSSSNEGWRPDGRMYLAYLPIYQGKFNQALEVLDDGLAADRMEQVEGRQNAYKHFLKAHIYKEKKNLNFALKEAEKGMEIRHRVYPDDPSYGQRRYAYLLIENNDFEKAEEVAEALKKDIEEKDQTWMSDYWWTVGYIELARGNFEASVTNFEKAARDVPYIWAHYPLAKAYLEAGRLGEAVAEFEKVLSRYDENRAYNAIWAVKAHYLLGLAYEKSGWSKKAIEQYEEFLEIWKDADPGIPEVEDAKQRLKALKVQS